MRKPRIGKPLKSIDFHDSFIKSFHVSDNLNEIKIIFEIPEFQGHKNWEVIFRNILKFEYESDGIALWEQYPISIHSIYENEESLELDKWRSQMSKM